MFTNLLLTVDLIAAAIGVCVCIAYLVRCSALEKHLSTTRPDYKEDKAALTAWQDIRRSMERKCVRMARICIVDCNVAVALCFALACMVPESGPEHRVVFALAMILSLTLFVFVLRAIFHNSRAVELDIERR